MMYSIVDVETTGGNQNQCKITEIAIYKFDGKEIVDSFVSLINPERQIPEFISNLTGITNEMVVDAPKFYEVAARVVEITRGTIFVAHNSAFDYGCFRSEFASLGYDFILPTICTVKLSRVLLPGHASYSLGKLCDELGIEINGRHRAGGDALATTYLFKILFEKNHGVISPDNPYNNLDPSLYHQDLDIDKVKQLPDSPGVYYLKDHLGEIIYIGHGKNIRLLVVDHLGRTKTQRSRKLLANIADVDCQKTGTALIASMLFALDVQKHQPRYNQAKASEKKSYGLVAYYDQKGYRRMRIAKKNKTSDFVIGFNTQQEGVESLYKWMDEYSLCEKLCGLYEGNSACLLHHQNQCKGACIGEELADSYNQRADALIDKLDLGYKHLVIIDKGRSDDEYSLVYIGNSTEIGYGYMDKDVAISNSDELIESVKFIDNVKEVKPILKNYLSGNPKPIKLIDLKTVKESVSM